MSFRSAISTSFAQLRALNAERAPRRSRCRASFALAVVHAQVLDHELARGPARSVLMLTGPNSTRVSAPSAE